jgi:hypothetical protein
MNSIFMPRTIAGSGRAGKGEKLPFSGRMKYLQGIQGVACVSVERSVSRDGDKVYLETENDGWSYMNRGPEPSRTEILSADEHGLALVDGSKVGSSSGHLEREAMRYFAEIASEQKSS